MPAPLAISLRGERRTNEEIDSKADLRTVTSQTFTTVADPDEVRGFVMHQIFLPHQEQHIGVLPDPGFSQQTATKLCTGLFSNYQGTT